ncbi:hypothetical protein AB0I22_16200 [Streptomyces sp. NPDC050610]|uniref:hypothetical protein n=1 Tax=Streptomyces sp. NPDC050610 TaxID=3157097 RepID=UPI00343ED1B5
MSLFSRKPQVAIETITSTGGISRRFPERISKRSGRILGHRAEPASDTGRNRQRAPDGAGSATGTATSSATGTEADTETGTEAETDTDTETGNGIGDGTATTMREQP